MADFVAEQERPQGKGDYRHPADGYRKGRPDEGNAGQGAGLQATQGHYAPGHPVKPHYPAPYLVRHQHLQGTLNRNHIDRLEGVMLAQWLKERDQRKEREAVKEAQKATELNQQWQAWYERQQAAFREGRPFDEPPPAGSGAGHQSRNGR